jgi:hypothetical protein
VTENARTLLLGFAGALVAGCNNAPSSPSGPAAVTRDTAALFQTDSLAYALVHRGGGYSMVVDAILTNRTTVPIYISNCGGATGIYLQKRTSTGWQIVRSPVLPACLSPAIVVAVGASRDFDVELVGGEPGSNLAPHYSTTDLNGEYRLLWDGAFSSYDGNSGTGAPLPESSRVSNHFVVRVLER